MTRLEKRLLSQVGRASRDFLLLEPNDRVMVALSGGKDSYAMCHLLHGIQKRAPFDFTLIAVNLDQGQPGFKQEVISDWCADRGYEQQMLSQDTYSVVLDKVPEGKTYCSLCSRLRRGILYNAADKLKATKIALGHHRDDLIETLLLNLFYSGQVKSMAPRLRSDDGRNVIIRPLAYCDEEDLAAFSDEQEFPILPCDLCGSQENLQRKQIKRMVAELQSKNGHIKGNLFASLSNIRPTHLLDPSLHSQEVLERVGWSTAEPLTESAARS
jgi:tRNA 2-thiocytidine biosynthesis protein TtcA